MQKPFNGHLCILFSNLFHKRTSENNKRIPGVFISSWHHRFCGSNILFVKSKKQTPNSPIENSAKRPENLLKPLFNGVSFLIYYLLQHFKFVNWWIGGFAFWMSRTGSKLTFPSFCHLHSPPMFSMTHLSSALAPGLTSVYWGSSRNICCAQQPGKENQGKRLANKKKLYRDSRQPIFLAANS